MKRRLFNALFILLAFPLFLLGFDLSGNVISDRLRHSPVHSDQQIHLNQNYSQLPLYFEPNQGQTGFFEKYLSQGAGYEIGLDPTEVTLNLRHAVKPVAPGERGSFATDKVRLKLKNANGDALLETVDRLPGISNYFIGNDRAQWRTNISHYARLKVSEVYPGIDLVYYGNQGRLEHDFLLAPGAEPRVLQWELSGMTDVKINGNGDLVLTTPGGEVTLRSPVAYQTLGGQRRKVEARYALIGKDRVGFDVGDYRKDQLLVIDPVLAYSTYLGSNEYGEAVAVDNAGYAYLVENNIVNNTLLVMKIDPSGTSLVYSTNMGSHTLSYGQGIVADGAGNAYVTGYTQDTSFPTQKPIQATLNGNTNAFVTKLNSNGTALVYSTFLGGSDVDQALAIAVDGSGNAYVTGNTTSTDFPLFNAIQSSFTGSQDIFVTKINAVGNAWAYSTYLGGNNYSSGRGIAVDGSGNAYVTGNTNATNFPTQNAIQSTLNGTSSVFVTEVNAAGTNWVYSTYLGGNMGDAGAAIAVDGSENAYVTGLTSSTNFPTKNPIQASLNGTANDAFVTKVAAGGTSLIYSTYLGGSSDDHGTGIGVDASGNAYVAGATGSSNFPTQNAIQGSTGGGGYDAFVTEINAGGTGFVYSTYLGGNGTDQAYAVAVDSTGDAVVTGQASSANFPTQNAMNSTNAGGGTNGFLLEISLFAPTPLFTATITNTPNNTVTNSPTSTPTNTLTPTATITGTLSPVPTNTATNSPTNSATITPTSTPTITPTATLTSSPTITITPTVSITPTITLTATPLISLGFPLKELPPTGGSYIAPEPVTGNTGTLAYWMAKSGTVKIRVFNTIGQLVCTQQETKSAGAQMSTVNFSGYAPGVYLYLINMTYDSGGTDSAPLSKFLVVR